jgi:hypothetical protein
MAPVMHGSRSARVGFSVYAVVLVGVLSTFLGVTHATQYIVGGNSQWSYLHANSAPTFYQEWASNKTFLTGDDLRRSLTFLATCVLSSRTSVRIPLYDV